MSCRDPLRRLRAEFTTNAGVGQLALADGR